MTRLERCGPDRKDRVYVSGPYSFGDQAENVRIAVEAADALLDAGLAPYVPHLWHFWAIHSPRGYEEWMRLDFAFLPVCNVLLRIEGHSPGADREEDGARRLGIPVVPQFRGGPTPVGAVVEALRAARAQP